MIDGATCTVLEFEKVKALVAGCALSPLGAQLVRNLSPGHDIDAIELLLERVDEMKTLIEYDDPFPLKSFDNIYPVLNRCTIEGSVLEPPEFLAVGRVLETVRLVKEYVTERRRKYLLLSEVCEPIEVYPDFETRLTRIFDDRGEVTDTASTDLNRIRRELKKGHEHLRATLNSILRTLTDRGMVQDSVITLREGRFVLPVKAEHCNWPNGRRFIGF